jgi:hypothetical protein
MDPNCLTLEQDAFNAYMLRGVMEATGQPGETPGDARTRQAAIIEIFRTFEAADPMESMIASHCVALRFLLQVAMRDANMADVEPAMTLRLRASAMAIGKNLQLWMASFANLHARNEARAAETRQAAGQTATMATPAKPQPAMQQPPAQPGRARPIAAQSAPPFVARVAGVDKAAWPAPRLPDQPVQSVKQALLSSAAIYQGAASNGRVTPPPL